MKLRNTFWVAAIIMLFSLVSCASSGKQFDTSHVLDVRKGGQDRPQIRAWFGEPHTVQALKGSKGGCVERWIYSHSYSSWGGAKTKSETLMVDFNKKGKVCDNAYLEQ
jgi:outer membrane protein assembly factor BamE (lipoprotein component of BamABCDE complex)